MTNFEKALEEQAKWQDDHVFRMEPHKEITHFASFKAGARWARQFTVDEHKDKINRVLNYCKSNTEAMWAATTVAILLDCDFRDSKQAIEQHFKDRGGE